MPPGSGPVAANPMLGPGMRPSIAPLASRGGTRPPSGMRMGTMGGGVQQNMQSVGLTTNVVVDARPVTRQGLTGMSTKPLGPGRQIADDRYYLTELRTRIADITQEMKNMREESEQIRIDNAKYQQHEREYEATITEVRSLEGQLADFNLALDKIRTNTAVSDIAAMHDQLKNRNQHESGTLDECFMATQNIFKKTKAVEADIQQIHEKAADRMASLGEEAQGEYQTLQEEHNTLRTDINEKETRLQELDHKIHHLQSKLKSHEYQVHQKGMELKKKKAQLLTKRVQLDEETDSSVPPEEMRERLLQKVKDANSDIEAADRRRKQMEDVIEKYHEEIRHKEQELTEAKKHSQKAKKYEAVYERDRKMQEFIDDFPKMSQKDKEDLGNLKFTIVALLKHISKGISLSENLPDAEQLADMKKELTCKEQLLRNSKDTLSLLNADKKKREEELDKINNLDKKISVELKSLKEKITSMEKELTEFKDEDTLKDEATQAKKRLLGEKQTSKKKRDAIKQQTHLLAVGFDKRKRELASNETMKRVDALEQKLRTYSQTVFSLSDFINTRKRESDYKNLLNQVAKMTSDANTTIIKRIRGTQ